MQSIPRRKTTQRYPEPPGRDFSPTEAALRECLQYVRHLAGVFDRGMRDIPGTPSLEEFVDYGVDGLLYAWRTWDASHGIPFWSYARHVVSLRMRSATRLYRAWHTPGSTQRPHAHHLRPPTPAPDATFIWLRRALTEHAACLSPPLRQALMDSLNECTHGDVSRRDGIGAKASMWRRRALLRFVRRHIVERETSCDEEQAAWKRGSRTARLGEEVANAAAD